MSRMNLNEQTRAYVYRMALAVLGVVFRITLKMHDSDSIVL